MKVRAGHVLARPFPRSLLGFRLHHHGRAICHHPNVGVCVCATILRPPAMTRSFMIEACSSDPPGSAKELQQERADRHPVDNASSWWLQTSGNNPGQQTGTSQKVVLWGNELTAATMVTYYGVLHVPLSIGGLSLVRGLLHLDVTEPQTKAISLILLQLMELAGAIGLIESTIKPFNFPSILLAFNFHNFLQERRSVLVSIGGLVGLFLIMGSLSVLTHTFLHGQAEESKQYLHEMLSGSTISIGCVSLVYCVITPFLEEYIYRGFLLTSFKAYMSRHSAIVLSAVLFSAAHFSLSNSITFFMIGCILGFISSSTTGNLVASLVVHSIYNLVVLMSVMIQGA